MKLLNVFLFLCFCSNPFYAQRLELYSIGNDRQPSGDNGYTLDGGNMARTRSKLLNPLYYGPTGTYTKTIAIHDTFVTSNSLVGIRAIPSKAILFFGTFDKNNGSTKPFTKAELDSVYAWSLRGGRVIMTAGLTFPMSNGDMRIMNDQYGFAMQNGSSEDLIGNPDDPAGTPFNGPFGPITRVTQGASAQGYYSQLPAKCKVLAFDQAERPTMVMDCKTMDILVADVDVFTMLNTENPPLTNPAIFTNSDHLLGNLLAFLDRQPDPPVVKPNGDVLSVESVYSSYQWYKDSQLIPGAVGPSINTTEAGQYHVEVGVPGGCKTPSGEYVVSDGNTAADCDVFVPTAFSPNGNGTNEKACVYSKCLNDFEFRVFDRWGELVFSSNAVNDCWDGRFRGQKLNPGVFAWSVTAKMRDGKKFVRKGHITLVE